METLANCLIYLAGILWGVELIPQIRKTLRTKDVSGLSEEFFAICSLAYSVYIIGNSLLLNYIIVIAHLPSMILLIVQMILIAKYRKK